MHYEHTLTKLLLFGFLGLLGQGIRVIVGLKKLREEVAKEPTQNSQDVNASFNRQFDAKQLWLSLFVGFVAGCLASFTRDEKEEMTNDVQLAIIAAGYAGTDFIEGVLKKVLPGK